LLSKRRLVVALLGVIVGSIGFQSISPDMQDRYLSIIGDGPKNAATADGRLAALESGLSIAMRRPLFGHGLGTSREVNANFGGDDKPAHDLYAEIAQELGFIGLFIFLALIRSIFRTLRECRRLLRAEATDTFMLRTLNATWTWLAVTLAFSIVSYGLSSYEWYLLAGLSVALRRLAPQPQPPRVEVGNRSMTAVEYSGLSSGTPPMRAM